jgi:DNA-binding NarL/FixJ family response regulator
MTSDVGVGKVLVAEPEECSRTVMLRILEEAGHEPIGVDSGEEAIETARHHRPSLAILEICLPGICGYDVCRRLKDRYGESVSVIFVSATRTESFDRVAGILLGADDYLCKPFAEDELLARIGRLIRRPTARANLTPRERDVLSLLVQGLTQREIADCLVISGKTVGTHTEHIFSKLGVRNRLQAAALAHRYRLVDP